MKRQSAVAAACLTMCLYAQAGIRVEWSSPFYFQDHTETFIGVTGATDDQVLMQLIWSREDPVANSHVADAFTTDFLDTSGTEKVLATYTTPNDSFGSMPGDDSPQVLDFDDSDVDSLLDKDVTKIEDGWIYSRIFETDTPSYGSYYLDSFSTAQGQDGDYEIPTLSTHQPGPPEVVGSRINHKTLTDSGLYADTEMVPEPTTMGLLAVGLLTLAARKRRRPRA